MPETRCQPSSYSPRAGSSPERPRRLADVGDAEAGVEQRVVGVAAGRRAQDAGVAEAFPQAAARLALEVVADLHAGRRGRLAQEQGAQLALLRQDVGERRHQLSSTSISVRCVTTRPPRSRTCAPRERAPGCPGRSTRAATAAASPGARPSSPGRSASWYAACAESPSWTSSSKAWSSSASTVGSTVFSEYEPRSAGWS